MPELLAAMVATKLVHPHIAFMQVSCLTYHFLFLVAAYRTYGLYGLQYAAKEAEALLEIGWFPIGTPGVEK